MPQKNIHLIWMFLVFPWIQMVFTIKGYLRYKTILYHKVALDV